VLQCNVMFLVKAYFDDCHHVVLLLSFNTTEGQSKHNSYDTSNC
jgi:hypothetical protein